MRNFKNLLILNLCSCPIYKINLYTNIHVYTNIKQKGFKELVPLSIACVKIADKARTCSYRRPFRLIYGHQINENVFKKKKERRETILHC